ncbi:cation:proton antiporter [Acinetobacter radioresistens]|nr:cation:proton antiporter [Acinetobacter radioresistens]
MSLMLYMTIFLGASLILVALSRRLGLTSVLGYLVTGLILGQSGFNLIKFSLIQNFIDYASILLVFLIGLELRPQRIWLMRSHLIKLGGIQIVITAGLIVTLGITVLQLPLLNSFIVGFALALSAMILALQLQTQYEQLNTTTGQYTLAVTLAQALVAIFLIALLPLFTRTESSQHGIAYFAATLATISGVFLLAVI